MKSIAPLLFASFLAAIDIALPFTARASSILATIHATLGFGRGPPPVEVPPQQILSLAYGSEIPNGPGGLPFLLEAPSSPCLGCDAPVPTGFTGTTDYTAGNTTDFADFATNLTNGVNEVLGVKEIIFESDPRDFFISGGELAHESFWLGLPSDLQGDNIDFVRRIVSSNTLTIRNVGIPPTPVLESDVDVRWEIFGTAQVPEPGSFTLLSTGICLTGIAIVRRVRLKFTRSILVPSKLDRRANSMRFSKAKYHHLCGQQVTVALRSSGGNG
jgi:hypothetical protein